MVSRLSGSAQISPFPSGRAAPKNPRIDAVPRVIRAKLHGLRVTGADLHYHGSITLDPEHCDKAGLYPTEFVEIWNKNSGARLTTYVIFGEPGSRCCILNGAAARTCQVGDELIIAAACDVQPKELYDLRPCIVTFTPNNDIDQVLHYEVFKSAQREFDFRIVSDATHQPAATHNYANVDVRGIRQALKAKGFSDPEIENFVGKFLTR
jgi:aspartate 1-decarboxylase